MIKWMAALLFLVIGGDIAFAGRCVRRPIKRHDVIIQEKIVEVEIVDQLVVAVPVTALDLDYYYSVGDNLVSDELADAVANKVIQRIRAQSFTENLSEESLLDRKVLGIFSRKCQSCHNSRKKTAGLSLSTLSHSWITKKKILESIDYKKHKFKLTNHGIRLMPLNGQPLTKEEVDTVKDWVEQSELVERE